MIQIEYHHRLLGTLSLSRYVGQIMEMVVRDTQILRQEILAFLGTHFNFPVVQSNKQIAV